MTEAVPTSRAIGIEPDSSGEPRFVERQVPFAPLGDHDLRVSVEAVSINPVDTKVARGVESFRILGFDGAGTVTEIGPAVTLFSPGDRVYWAGSITRAGSNQTHQLVDERVAALAPTSLSSADAASIPLTAITAWEALFDKLRLTSSDTGTILIVGAAGGVGSVLIQLVRALLPGVTIIGTASRPESQDWARKLGAHHVIDPRSELVDQVLAIAPDGVDWIFSAWSSGRLDDYARVITSFGQIVGIDGGPIDVTPLKPKSATWHWEYMFTRSTPVGEQHDHHRILTEVARLIDEGLVSATATTIIPGLTPESLSAAHSLVASGSVIGKVVVTVDAS